jgi:trehalose-6-phosphate synthase
MVKTNQDDSWQYIQSDTGLKSAIDYLSEGNNIKWISWPGAVVDESSQDGVRRKLEVIKLTRTFYDQKYDKGTNESCSQSIIAGQCFLIARP